ncbi:MAG: arsenate reductase family protein [Cyclobacteriaceae bacterium]
MKKAFHLSTCNTCQRIIKDLGIGDSFAFQDIKSEPITEAQLDAMAQMVGSYEALFSRKARKFRALQLNQQNLEEKDYRKLILEEYTFLKRPVFIVDENIFIGNSRKNIEALAAYLGA